MPLAGLVEAWGTSAGLLMLGAAGRNARPRVRAPGAVGTHVKGPCLAVSWQHPRESDETLESWYRALKLGRECLVSV